MNVSRWTGRSGRAWAALLGVVLAALLLAIGLTGMPRAIGQTDDPVRLAGADRYGTAVAVSKHKFPDGATSAYVARADAGPDALVSSFEDGPTLLVPPCGTVPEVVIEELDRLGADRVYIVGGEAAVSPSVGRQLAARMSDPTVSCGDDREQGDVELTVSRIDETPEGFIVDATVVNHLDETVQLNLGVVIEQQVSAGTWEAVPSACCRPPLEYQQIPPGERSEPVQISPYFHEEGQSHLGPGHYRARVLVVPASEQSDPEGARPIRVKFTLS